MDILSVGSSKELPSVERPAISGGVTGIIG